MNFLTIDEVAVGETVRVKGTQISGTITKKYSQKIEIAADGRTYDFYPSDVTKVAAPSPDGIKYGTGDTVEFWVPLFGSRRQSGGVVAESVPEGDSRPVLVTIEVGYNDHKTVSVPQERITEHSTAARIV